MTALVMSNDQQTGMLHLILLYTTTWSQVIVKDGELLLFASLLGCKTSPIDLLLPAKALATRCIRQSVKDRVRQK